MDAFKKEVYYPPQYILDAIEEYGWRGLSHSGPVSLIYYDVLLMVFRSRHPGFYNKLSSYFIGINKLEEHASQCEECQRFLKATSIRIAEKYNVKKG